MGRIIQEMATSDFEMASPESADLILDFSSPAGTLHALEMAERLGKPLVSGTTGLTPSHFNQMREASKKIAILHSPNFSIGIAALFKMTEGLQHLPGAKIEIRETHHVHKKDAPSGTALKLKELLGGAPISWEREGETVGAHEVIINFANETLVLKHVAHSRRAFAEGALLAVKLIINKSPGLYNLKDFI